MNNKNFLVKVALILIVVGMCLSISAFAFSGFDFYNLYSLKQNFELKRYEIKDELLEIQVKDVYNDVLLLNSKDEKIHIEYFESDYVKYDITKNHGKLLVEYKEYFKWYQHIGFNFRNLTDKRELRVYLPKSQYENLKIETVSGDINTGGMNFDDVDLNTVSGEIKISGKQGDISIHSVSGNINLEDVDAKKLDFQTTSGDMELNNVIMEDTINVKTISGNVKLEDVDAKKLDFETTSGDIKGNILSDKKFSVENVSGNINLPSSNQTDEIFYIRTISGDVEITIK